MARKEKTKKHKVSDNFWFSQIPYSQKKRKGSKYWKFDQFTKISELQVFVENDNDVDD